MFYLQDYFNLKKAKTGKKKQKILLKINISMLNTGPRRKNTEILSLDFRLCVLNIVAVQYFT